MVLSRVFERRLQYVLWAYNTTSYAITNETPRRGRKIGWRRTYLIQGEDNSQEIRENLNFLDDKRCFIALADSDFKQVISPKCNKKAKPMYFHPSDLVLQRADIGDETSEKGNLLPIGKDSTEFELAQTREVTPFTWNLSKGYRTL